jgi:hypothetical protein
MNSDMPVETQDGPASRGEFITPLLVICFVRFLHELHFSSCSRVEKGPDYR